jgi:DNA modification methylase
VDWTAAYKLFPGDVAYVWHAGVHAGEVAAGLTSVGFEIRAQIIWSKQHFAMSRGHYHWGHEPCWYAVRKGGRANWCGDRTQSTIWQVQNLNPMGGDRDEKATGHGTQKPVELMRRPIVNHTKRGDAIYDPFLGSGTTIMAAELTERFCCGIDIDPRYVDVAVIRWQGFTGQEATLDGDGRTFEQVKAERLGVAA